MIYCAMSGVLVSFTADEGAGRHCEPMAHSLRDARIFDWPEDYLR
jgi:hypothetical protein